MGLEMGPEADFFNNDQSVARVVNERRGREKGRLLFLSFDRRRGVVGKCSADREA